MAVLENTPLKAYTATGASAVFAYDFPVLDAADMAVLVNGSAPTSFVVSGAGNPAGGTVTITPTPSAGQRVVLFRDSEVSRSTDYQSNGDLLAAVVNRDFDRLWLVLQEVLFGTKAPTASVRAPVGEALDELPDAASRANKLQSFDSNGHPVVVAPVSGSATDLAVQLASTDDAAEGAGQIGSNWQLNYVARTVGNDLRYGSIPSIFKVFTEAQQQDVLNYAYTLDLYATIAAALALCKTWYFPAGGYKITDELTVVTGMRMLGDSNADTVYGAQTTTNRPTRFYQATANKSVFKIGVGVSDVVIADMALSAVQAPAPYTAPTSGKYGIEMVGEAYDAGTQPNGRSSYRIHINRLSFYQFERGISIVDQHWEAASPPAGADWQCDSVKIADVHTFSCLHGIYVNTTNADALSVRDSTFNVWTNGSAIYLKRSGYVTLDTCYWVAAEASAGVAATGNTGLYVESFYDNVLMMGCQGETLSYFMDVDTTTGFENVYNQITMDGCVVESPIRIRRQAKIISRGTRYTEDVTCSGDDIEIHSTADSWSPTTKKFIMSGLRPRLFVHGGSSQTTGTVSAATATATTAFTLPASLGAYRVYAQISAGGSLYQSYAILACDGTTLARVAGTNGANLTITVSGRNVQVTQTSGVTQTVAYSYVRDA